MKDIVKSPVYLYFQNIVQNIISVYRYRRRCSAGTRINFIRGSYFNFAFSLKPKREIQNSMRAYRPLEHI